MDLMSIIQTGLTMMYMFMIFNSLDASIKDLLKSQQVFGGKLLFFIYSLLVYYKGFMFHIPFWDFFFNTPIYNAYSVIDYFTSSFIGVSIAPPTGFMYFFLFIIPAMFIYRFVQYWTSYLFMDQRIGKLAGILGVSIFATAGGVGLINSMTIPLGFPGFGTGLMSSLLLSWPFSEFASMGVGLIVGVVLFILFTYFLFKKVLIQAVETSVTDTADISSVWMFLALVVLSLTVLFGGMIGPFVGPAIFGIIAVVLILLSIKGIIQKPLAFFMILVLMAIMSLPLLASFGVVSFAIPDTILNMMAFVFLLMGLAAFTELMMLLVLVMLQAMLKKAATGE
ncbi:MAG: hypothetical protein GOU99_03395 [Candidatus Altiarchaeota archaeon]|nr:hypothetical protein [Candidatus Altiarchaeota archaeon]